MPSIATYEKKAPPSSEMFEKLDASPEEFRKGDAVLSEAVCLSCHQRRRCFWIRSDPPARGTSTKAFLDIPQPGSVTVYPVALELQSRASGVDETGTGSLLAAATDARAKALIGSIRSAFAMAPGRSRWPKPSASDDTATETGEWNSRRQRGHPG